MTKTLMRVRVALSTIVLSACGAIAAERPPGAASMDGTVAARPIVGLSAVSMGNAPRERVVVRDRPSWERYWAFFHRSHVSASDRPPVEAVDFQTEMVIVAAMGSQRSTGYRITIDSVYVSTDDDEITH